jgi:hypothetical protein
VHATLPASVVLAVTVVVQAAAGRALVTRAGPVFLPTPTPLGIFLTIAYSVAIGLAAWRQTDPHLELLGRQRSLLGWRAAWLVACTLAITGVAVVLTAVAHGPVAAVGNNAVLFAGLSVLAACWGGVNVMWVPAVLWVFVAALFGGTTSGEHPYAPWAFVIERGVSVDRVVVSWAVWAAAVVVYATTPRLRRGRAGTRPA